MHLLAVTSGAVEEGEAVDLGQTPGEIVILSAADTELALLADAQRRRLEEDPCAPTLRLANIMALGHNLSVDLHVEHVLCRARLVVVRLLGGRGYWPYGVERLGALEAPVALLPGDDRADPELSAFSSLDADACRRLWCYLAEGGPDNALNCLRYAAHLLGRPASWQEPAALPRAQPYTVVPGTGPVAPLLFYRAHLQAGNVAAIDMLAREMAAAGLAPRPVAISSLKDPDSLHLLTHLFAEEPPAVIVNSTGFAARGADGPGPLDRYDCPVIQAVLSGGAESVWREGARGLSPRDIAMNIALPELDGRLISRAVSFKAPRRRDAATECDITRYCPVPDRARFVAELAANWARLRQPGRKRVALVLANYPTRDGRIGNGVGLDTPASALVILRALGAKGVPVDGDTLMRRLQQSRTEGPVFSERAFRAFLDDLPTGAAAAVRDRWGLPCQHMTIPALLFGDIAVAVQPSRGYDIDPASSYHDPALPPPPAYLAFYGWLRRDFGAHAVIHLGKHGNLEWLPGKALALSRDCFPDAVFGAMPNLYPFIVNDPGEGSQAKRRTHAAILDHLTPPLTRAGSHGPMVELERLVDEYYQAAALDPRRLPLLARAILDLAGQDGLAADCGIRPEDGEEAALSKLDGYLCELKELQIRDGLHVFGTSPQGRQRRDLLVAAMRAQLLPALTADLGLELGENLAAPWTGPRPAFLAGNGIWRTTGDTLERLETAMERLVESVDTAPGPESATALGFLKETLAPALDQSGGAEIAGLKAGLAGRFVEPGPSGAPTRGRPDVLPTGRNFYSVDTRAVPTPAAAQLGWHSAALLIERHVRDHGEWPRALALSAWGTSAMRTGGDDIAQALALIGVRPTWDSGSGRVTGFEIVPRRVLDRPRVDVTLRISGFFRDAFPGLIDLFDSAVRAVAGLDEHDNPLYTPGEDGFREATWRVFGSMPGAYGAGLQALIDEGGWNGPEDLARAFVTWGGYAYGAGEEGKPAHRAFERRLACVEAIVHNQDNREHDLLDSDDYYQFEGGLAAATALLSGRRPAVYHNDHTRPERPRIMSLEEEIARTVRARAANPKWIRGVMRHGYKGAFEIAATVDYLFAFAATTGAVRDWHFEMLFDAYIRDEAVRAFMERSNPAALRETAARFLEALDRGLWRPRANFGYDLLQSLASGERP